MAEVSTERKLQEELKHESTELRRHLDKMSTKFEQERKHLAGKIDELHESLILANKKHQDELLELRMHANEYKS